ncbi:MAG: hypothetical protein PHF17_03920 [Arcobacteraceae bacterium]|nr:hypothetical protein [Arcobacteraceae bacterium]
MKVIVTLEIEIKDNIKALYPNFIYNYEDKQDFLEQQIASLNHNLQLEEQVIFQHHHINYDNADYETYDDGYKQKVLKVKTLTT